ncbi:MAG: ribose 5-phosphate isomerase B [Leptospiraceae bacterium]|nr:ribose 5-phosphate isomerase B [Leptospiraceae bacterium]MCB1199329.1 ribose 5-phosphate isomerase B [Leptospiraceae bacterium]
MNEAEIRAIVEKVIERMANVEPTGAAQVAVGGDHGGFPLKKYLAEQLTSAGFSVIDCGTYSTDAVDYPDIAAKVAETVAQGKASRGIIVDTAGIGSCMAANKIKGIRAALCYNEKTILNSRVHNNANVLTLGAAYHEPGEALQLAKLWLSTEFEGGRHQKRIDKISALEGCGCKS